MKSADASFVASADLWRCLARAMALPDAGQGAIYAALALNPAGSVDDWRAAHTEAFIHQCAPYISIYVGENGQIGGEAAARVADFRRLLGAERLADSPDDIADVLADYAELVALAGDDAQAAHARYAMFWEHIAPWLGPLTAAWSRSAPEPFAGWAKQLQAACLAEGLALGAPSARALQLRHAPVWCEPAPDATHIEVARAILVPVTSGLVITRADLARAGQALGIALPVGTREFLLETLFKQSVEDTRQWLAELARQQAEGHRANREALGDAAGFWAQRATAMANWLAQPAAQERDATSRLSSPA